MVVVDDVSAVTASGAAKAVVLHLVFKMGVLLFSRILGFVLKKMEVSEVGF